MNIDYVREKLVDILNQLQESADALGNKSISEHAFDEMEKLKHGILRIMVAGITSSGKSTVINGLYSTILVPEYLQPSTLVPTWIGSGSDSSSCAKLYFRDGKPCETYKIDEFRKAFCYKKSDVLDENRSAYRNIKWASIQKPEHKFSKNGIILVDTLGIGSSSTDEYLTLNSILKDADALIYVVNVVNGTLLENDIEFLRKNILRYEDNGKSNRGPVIPPERIIIALNKCDLVPDFGRNIIQTIENQIKLILTRGDEKFNEHDYKVMCANVVRISGLFARVGRAGVYPYFSELVDESQEEKLTAEDYSNYEKSMLNINGADKLVNESCIHSLEEKIMQLSELMYKGEDSIFGRRLNGLSKLADFLIEEIEHRYRLTTIKSDELKRAYFVVMDARRKIERERNSMRGTVEEIADRMVNSIENMINLCVKDQLIADKMISKADSYIESLEMPYNMPSYKEFLEMNQDKRILYFENNLLPYVIKCLKCFGEITAEEMFNPSVNLSSTEQIETPMDVANMLEEYINAECSIINDSIRKISEAQNYTGISMVIPTEDILNQKINDAVFHSRETVVKSFEILINAEYWRKIALIEMMKIKQGFWQWLGEKFGKGGMTNAELWTRLKSVIKDVARNIYFYGALEVASMSKIHIDATNVLKVFFELSYEIDKPYDKLSDELGNSVIKAWSDIEKYREWVSKNKISWDEIVEQMTSIKQSIGTYKNEFCR